VAASGAREEGRRAIEGYVMRTQQLPPNPPMHARAMRRLQWDVKQGGGQIPSKLDRQYTHLSRDDSVTGSRRLDPGVEERSSSLVKSKMGRSSGIWGVRVKQKVGR
jgi:hypothetical protein